MINSLKITAIAFSPFVAKGIVKYCDDKEKGWEGGNIKSAMGQIANYQKIMLVTSPIIVILATSDLNNSIAIPVLIGASLGFSYSLVNIFFLAKKINGIIEPFLKVSFCGAQQLIITGSYASVDKQLPSGYGTSSV